jgi:S1-C subfamily serine protease
MTSQKRRFLMLGALAALAVALAPWAPGALGASARAADLDELQEKAIQEAVKAIAPCVVRIETSGGTEVVKTGPKGALRTGSGPTTGLVVSADGYVITSAFNFANKPSTIRVTVPGLKERRVARVIATDQSRMLTLLKIMDLPKGTRLQMPQAVRPSDTKIGYTAIAVGRTITPEADGTPSVSVGIISAIDRIWGKAVQTDAKVSPTNYGGPLIDLYGRVYGVLVPASPDAEGETAGFSWYDSGVGFAIRLSDINGALPRMLRGTPESPMVLRAGFLGLTMQSPDIYGAEPKIGTVTPGSAADKAGLKVGDVIKEVDGKEVLNYAQVRHRLGGRYEGDVISMKVTRGGTEINLARVVLGSAAAAFGPTYFGILPVRDDPAPGVEVRYVYPKGPADRAGIKEGDRIMKVGPAVPMKKKGKQLLRPITRGRDELMALFETARPGTEVRVELKRKAGGTQQVTVRLEELKLDDAVPGKLPEKASAKKALIRPGAKGAPKKDKEEKKPETGFLKRTTPSADATYWIYVPDTYDPNIACAVVVWLHPVGKNKEKDIEDFVTAWQSYCDDHHIILVCPKSDNPRGWAPGESAFVQQAVQAVADTYTVDRRRVVAHGMAVGGEMAYFLGFQARALFRGVSTVAAPLTSNPRERSPTQSVSFFLVAGGKDPGKGAVADTKTKLQDHKYPVLHEEVPNMGHEYIDGKTGTPTLERLVRWLDSLDRL